MERVRDASPDLVKALLLHNSDGVIFDPALGFGTPTAASLPWECRPGFVTLHWRDSLRSGAAYYWELPIPDALKGTGKLKGAGALTAILNPHPMVTGYAGLNYFSVRLETALQYQRGLTPKGEAKFNSLLGSLDTGKITEQEARALDHKWSPVRHHNKSFRGKDFEGEALRIYARVFARDLRGLGLFGLGKTAKEASIAADLAVQGTRVISAAEAYGSYRALPEADLFDMEYWSLEQAKLRQGK